jgi:DNA-binding GntR family transcriptional regulator
MTSFPPHVTKAELALRVLRERIRDGDLRPGERIQVEEIARELGMSQTPVREALRLLQADRLIDYQTHRGAVITEVPADTLVEIFRLRCLLEPLAVRLAVPHLTGEALEALEARHREFVALAETESAPRVSELNHAWHWEIYEASGSVFMMDFVRRLWDAFPWRTVRLLPGAGPTSMSDHEAVMVAIRKGDADAAGEAMLAHIARTKDMLLSD